MLHEKAPIGQIHIPYNWIFINSESMLQFSDARNEDVGKLALVDDTKTLWMLVSVSPVSWRQISILPTDIDSAIQNHVQSGSPHPQYQTQDQVNTIVENIRQQHEQAPNPHPQYQTQQEVEEQINAYNSLHVSLENPHPQYQTSEQVLASIQQVIGAAPAALDTLNEIAVALGNDPNFAGTITTQLSQKAPIEHVHEIGEIVNLQSAMNTKSNIGHSHVSEDIEDLESLLQQRAPLTHVHDSADISGLSAQLDQKAPITHLHTQTDVQGLADALASKAPAVHVHPISAITSLQAALDSKSPTTHTHTPASIGAEAVGVAANLVQQHTLARNPHATRIEDIAGLRSEIDSKANLNHMHELQHVWGLESALEQKANTNDVYTKSECDNRIQQVIGAAPAALDTLNEIAVALGNDPNFAGTITTQLSQKANSTDVYTKNETDSLLMHKSDVNHTHNYIQNEIYVIMTSEFSTGTTTYTDVPEMTVELEANSVYNFSFNLLAVSSNTNSGVGIGFTGTAGYESMAYLVDIPTSNSSRHLGMARGLKSGVLSASSPSPALSAFPCCVTGTIVTTASGTMTLQFRGEVSGGTYKLLRGSNGTFRKVE